MEAELLKRNGPVTTSTSGSATGSNNSTCVTVRKNGAHSPLVPVNGKLVFSLKQKSRLATNVLKMGEDDEEDDEGGDDPGRQSKKQKTAKQASSIAAVPAEPKDEGIGCCPPLVPKLDVDLCGCRF